MGVPRLSSTAHGRTTPYMSWHLHGLLNRQQTFFGEGVCNGPEALEATMLVCHLKRGRKVHSL